MNLTAWRIVKNKYARAAFDGEGARLYGGRWNSPGTPIVYTAESRSLAVLELLVHFEFVEPLDHYVLISAEIRNSLVQSLGERELPRNWRRHPAPARLQEIGDEWVAANRCAVLRVPSVVLPAENNYLLNPRHPDFRKIKIGTPQRFRLDPRLLQ